MCRPVSLTLWVLVAVTVCSFYDTRLMVAADTATFTRSDITGNDVDCGQGSGRCRVCGDINAIDSSCRANPSCTAYTFDNSCGFLKSAGEPRSYREGYSSFILRDKSSGGSSGSSGATPAPSNSPSTSSPVPAAAQPQDSSQGSNGNSQSYNSPSPTAPPPEQYQQQQQQQQQQPTESTMQVSNGGGGGGGQFGGRFPSWGFPGLFVPGRKLMMAGNNIDQS